MDESEKRIRRSALKLVAYSMAIGFLIGLAVGATITYNSIDRVIVVPLEPGVELLGSGASTSAEHIFAVTRMGEGPVMLQVDQPVPC